MISFDFSCENVRIGTTMWDYLCVLSICWCLFFMLWKIYLIESFNVFYWIILRFSIFCFFFMFTNFCLYSFSHQLFSALLLWEMSWFMKLFIIFIFIICIEIIHFINNCPLLYWTPILSLSMLTQFTFLPSHLLCWFNLFYMLLIGLKLRLNIIFLVLFFTIITIFRFKKSLLMFSTFWVVLMSLIFLALFALISIMIFLFL